MPASHSSRLHIFLSFYKPMPKRKRSASIVQQAVSALNSAGDRIVSKVVGQVKQVIAATCPKCKKTFKTPAPKSIRKEEKSIVRKDKKDKAARNKRIDKTVRKDCPSCNKALDIAITV
jgi:predicted aldo/keto reductase-like oxidoreductase